MDEFFKNILMKIPEVVLVFDDTSTILFANTAFGSLTKRRTRDFIGKSLEDMDAEFKGQWEVLIEQLANRPKEFEEKFSTDVRCGTSQNHADRDPLCPVKAPSSEVPPPTILTLGDRFYTYQFFDVGEMEGKGRGVGVLLSELTDEKKKLDRLAQIENQASLATLAAGIAHEMNNPLFTIMANAEAIASTADTTKISVYAAKIKDKSKHLASIISDFSGFALKAEADRVKQEIQLREQLETVINAVSFPYDREGLHIEKNYDETITMNIIPQELQMILANIMKNALQAMNGKGKLIVSSAREGSEIKVLIQDNGPGIPEGFLPRLFDPFFYHQGSGGGFGPWPQRGAENNG